MLEDGKNRDCSEGNNIFPMYAKQAVDDLRLKRRDGPCEYGSQSQTVSPHCYDAAG